MSDVRGYTLAQLRAFTAAADRAHRRELVQGLQNLRAAQLDAPHFKAYVKELQHGAS